MCSTVVDIDMLCGAWALCHVMCGAVVVSHWLRYVWLDVCSASGLVFDSVVCSAFCSDLLLLCFVAMNFSFAV